jgi:predicted amidophosphoribosyltransferase
VVEHDGAARELVLALKLRGSRAAADAIGAMLAVPVRAVDAGAAIVPVPAAPERRRRRGFDPAALIAARLARRTGRPLDACLSRPRGDARQVGLRAGARRRGPRVEAIRPPPPIVLLVDDVHTTGATLDACARALREAGTRQVYAVSFARTLRGA